MKPASVDSLGHRASQRRVRRCSTTLTIALSAVLTASICVLPARMAFADQVLELPQAAAPVSSQYASGAPAAAPEPERQAMAPMPAGIGSVDEYESQGESSYPAGIASTPSNLHIDPNRNRDGLVKDLVLGALVIGLFALEVHAAQQHRHR